MRVNFRIPFKSSVSIIDFLLRLAKHYFVYMICFSKPLSDMSGIKLQCHCWCSTNEGQSNFISFIWFVSASLCQTCQEFNCIVIVDAVQTKARATLFRLYDLFQQAFVRHVRNSIAVSLLMQYKRRPRQQSYQLGFLLYV